MRETDGSELVQSHQDKVRAVATCLQRLQKFLKASVRRKTLSFSYDNILRRVRNLSLEDLGYIPPQEDDTSDDGTGNGEGEGNAPEQVAETNPDEGKAPEQNAEGEANAPEQVAETNPDGPNDVPNGNGEREGIDPDLDGLNDMPDEAPLDNEDSDDESTKERKMLDAKLNWHQLT